MPAQKPSLNRSPTPYALQVRLTKAQYAYLLLHAEASGSMGAALRQVLDDKIDTTPMYNDMGDDYQGEPVVASTSMRWVLEHADIDNLDELAAQLSRDE